jgi:hypothetical protein
MSLLRIKVIMQVGRLREKYLLIKGYVFHSYSTKMIPRSKQLVHALESQQLTAHLQFKGYQDCFFNPYPLENAP